MIDRRRLDEPDPFLDWKVRIFFAGAALLVAGVVLQRDVLALLAALVLAVGAALMLVTRYRQRRREEARMAEYDES
jgi:membrane protein implicated in regulation of membrane protease activity